MKQQIQSLITDAVTSCLIEQYPSSALEQPVIIERSRDSAHGDFACNIAMVMAKQLQQKPRDLAADFIRFIPPVDLIEKTEIAGPGFINIFLRSDAYYSIIDTIFEQGNTYGESNLGQGQKTLLEFVSANPTGPLHIGHGRGAAYGAVVASLLRAAGFHVDCEYYVNDAGRQMDILALSVWLRYLQQQNINVAFPDNAYQGTYINDIAASLINQFGDAFVCRDDEIIKANQEPEPEQRLDNLIHVCKRALNDKYILVFDNGLNCILQNIEKDLHEFGVDYQRWFSERTLIVDGKVKDSLTQLEKKDWLYKKYGSIWFASSKLGDEKDRVLVRNNDQPTYFASDVAYHQSKFARGYDKIINIWGADHHGYIARVKAALTALKLDASKLKILLVQFATLYQGKKKLQMSTRSGEFITLNELQREVGKDATRFFYILKKSEQHLDFDLELAKSQSSDNPVYYIQYAHARICSVFRQLSDKQLGYERTRELDALAILTDRHELKLLATLARYAEVVESAALSYEPHQLAYYLKDLANDFHGYYNSSQFLVEDDAMRNARLSLIDACKQVIVNGLTILGVSAPEVM